jgi:hypothetical protein
MVTATKRKPVGNNEMIAFLMLNTNDDAYFSHGETSVPVKEGTIVTFPGEVVHQTVIHSGSVKLLGPFDVLGMQSVGTTPAPVTPAPVTPAPVTPDTTPAPAQAPEPSEPSTPAPATPTQNIFVAIKSAKPRTIKSAKAPNIKSKRI